MEKRIAWQEGEGNIVASFQGEKDGTISFVSDTANEGIDRSQTVRVHTEDNVLNVTMTVSQSGKREVFNVQEGEFLLSSGDTFNVLKKMQ